MSITFNADEIFEMAEEIERNGANFYKRAAEGSAGSQAKDMLLELANWELQHEKLFADMRSELSGQEAGTITFDPDDQAALYLQAMADGHVFDVSADPAEKLTGNESLEEIFRTAIGLEKDSIVFYLGIRDMVPERMGKDKIDRIINEEKGHVAQLAGKLNDARGE